MVHRYITLLSSRAKQAGEPSEPACNAKPQVVIPTEGRNLLFGLNIFFDTSR